MACGSPPKKTCPHSTGSERTAWSSTVLRSGRFLLPPGEGQGEGLSGPNLLAAESGNLIVKGDNLHTLKAPLPRYAGQVKCIHIDPPCNTGNEGWADLDALLPPA